MSDSILLAGALLALCEDGGASVWKSMKVRYKRRPEPGEISKRGSPANVRVETIATHRGSRNDLARLPR